MLEAVLDVFVLRMHACTCLIAAAAYRTGSRSALLAFVVCINMFTRARQYIYRVRGFSRYPLEYNRPCPPPCVHRVPAARTLTDSVANRGRPSGRAGSHAGVSTEQQHPALGRNSAGPDVAMRRRVLVGVERCFWKGLQYRRRPK